MYDGYYSRSKFKEIRNLINDFLDGDCNLTIEEISERCYQYYEADLLSSGQYDYLSSMIEDLEE